MFTQLFKSCFSTMKMKVTNESSGIRRESNLLSRKRALLCGQSVEEPIPKRRGVSPPVSGVSERLERSVPPPVLSSGRMMRAPSEESVIFVGEEKIKPIERRQSEAQRLILKIQKNKVPPQTVEAAMVHTTVEAAMVHAPADASTSFNVQEDEKTVKAEEDLERIFLSEGEPSLNSVLTDIIDVEEERQNDPQLEEDYQRGVVKALSRHIERLEGGLQNILKQEELLKRVTSNVLGYIEKAAQIVHERKIHQINNIKHHKNLLENAAKTTAQVEVKEGFFECSESNAGSQLHRSINNIEACSKDKPDDKPEIEIKAEIKKELAQDEQQYNIESQLTKSFDLGDLKNEPDEDISGKKYTEVLKEMNQKIDIGKIGIKVDRLKKTEGGDILVKLKGKGAAEKLKQEMDTRMSGMNMAIRKKEIHFTITGLDPGVTEERLHSAIKSYTGIPKDEVDIKSLRTSRYGEQLATIAVPPTKAVQLRKYSSIIIGWVSCPIMEKHTPVRCYKCLLYGHNTYECKGESRVACCYNCFKSGHTAVQCSGTAYCLTCKEEGHRMDRMACPAYRAWVYGRGGERVPLKKNV
ncbi:unnamed protein product [Diabrotica balteata]|uniref:CCHC-type domain-containing protein n=1 Tax=Diabrotica balteata TaxID=107213 RepID=A0A9N9TFS3_DIABA|nr:unnamed protein product [Diabrotica balteata]